ncbi:MAG: hypothetical protein ACKVXR_14545 [Planctomycetota bacterium]
MTSRYADQPDVSIDEQNVPEELRALLPLARIWAIGDDVERNDFMEQASVEERKHLVDTVAPHFEALSEWSSVENRKTPVPDVVVLLDMLAEAAAEALLEVYPDGR